MELKIYKEFRQKSNIIMVTAYIILKDFKLKFRTKMVKETLQNFYNQTLFSPIILQEQVIVIHFKIAESNNSYRDTLMKIN